MYNNYKLSKGGHKLTLMISREARGPVIHNRIQLTLRFGDWRLSKSRGSVKATCRSPSHFLTLVTAEWPQSTFIC